jgi:acyl-CoA synthetase (AMP-forming)/AMP-acid ligase II
MTRTAAEGDDHIRRHQHLPAEVEQVMNINARWRIPPSPACRSRDGREGACLRGAEARRAIAGEELSGFCRQSLSRYKVPKSFRFLDKLPRDSGRTGFRAICCGNFRPANRWLHHAVIVFTNSMSR